MVIINPKRPPDFITRDTVYTTPPEAMPHNQLAPRVITRKAQHAAVAHHVCESTARSIAYGDQQHGGGGGTEPLCERGPSQWANQVRDF